MQGEQRGERDQERRRVQQRHGPPAGHGVEADAGHRRDEPQPLAHGLQDGVGRAEQLGREHRGQQRGLAGGQQRVGRAVGHRHEVDDPQVPAVVDGQQRQHGQGGQRIHPQQQRAAAHTVDEQAGQRRRDLGRGDAEDDHRAGGRAAGQLARPQGQRQPQGGVAEQRERLADEIQPRVAQPEQAAHHGVR
jgi:hypothetical protein